MGEEPGLKIIKRNDDKIITRIEKPGTGERIKDLGGKCEDESIEGYVGQIVKQEGEGKFRCRECEKLFKGIHFYELLIM